MRRVASIMNCQRATQPRIPPVANRTSPTRVVAFGNASDRPHVVGWRDVYMVVWYRWLLFEVVFDMIVDWHHDTPVRERW